MADPSRSIESILAALAAQRPPSTASASTPAQPPPGPPGYQQSPTPSAYPPSIPPPGAQPMPYASGSYPLPQPTSSGNFDLSAIKPVNSGTVNFADAIAQARAFASENGLTSHDPRSAPPYQSLDPRGGNGDTRHYRSRSRSPPARRDAYRDNFNPYRDERREDSRNSGHEHGRNRSRSPGGNRGRPSGAFSPRGAGGGGGAGHRGADDEDSEIMQIESSLVGLIIGRQGENLRRIEQDNGVRVQFIPADTQGPMRQCRITGPRARRAGARAAIDKIVEDSGMGSIPRAGLDNSAQGGGRGGGASGGQAPVQLKEGEDLMQIMVPDRTVGLIIGRGGETIKDLQERSGCHINIVGESKSVNGLRPVNLIGTREATAVAKEAIMEIVDSDNRNMSGGGGGGGGGKPDRQSRNDHGGRDGQGMGGVFGGGGGGDKIHDSIYVPSDAVGMIIGKGGETIREMQNSTGCKINVNQSAVPGEDREIGLIGSLDAIQRAKQAIEDKVEAVRQKNAGGGGGGGGGRGGARQNRRDFDNPNYTPQGSGQSNPPAGGQPPPAAASGGADPYAPYGGYNNYVALWYQALAQQQNAGGQAPDAPKPA